ncbi:hypothetical protein LQF59_06855 [Tetragenococcus koreensis]|uniref:phage tail assembly chaperone GT n=1 Tax=Tetragenococcus koreensis TaxID=290335 RepID=UPI001F25CA09|nr:hypothetical protein [Tetragenococcus koreensis]MCF1614780.1 hypothetical protein [Tetragenococcus koreensis]MCF1624654.1 hypothetical protein [Tetragenococcus koreensis]
MSYADHKKNLKKVMLQMMKEGGKDINDILDMPFAFFMELVDESNKKNVKKTDSMIQAFM